MYSHEIKEMIDAKGYLTRSEYLDITPRTCPQIQKISYNTFTNKFHISTKDGYELEFEVRIE